MRFFSLLLTFSMVFLLSCAHTRLTEVEREALNEKPEKYISEEALGFYNLRRYKKAIDAYQIILEKPDVDPKFALWAQYEIAFCYYIMNDFENAQVSFKKLLDMYSDSNLEYRAPRILAEKMIGKIKSGDTHL